jgi:hypothetical protein
LQRTSPGRAQNPVDKGLSQGKRLIITATINQYDFMTTAAERLQGGA